MPDPLVVIAAREFQAALLAREDAALLEMARRWLGVERALEGEIETLAEWMAEQEEISAAALFRMERYEQLQGQLLVEMRQYQDYAQLQINSQQEINALAGIQDAAVLTQATADYYGARLAFNILPVEAVENIVALARVGQPLGILLEAAYPQAATAIADRLVQGVALGYNPRKTAKMVVEQGLSQGLNHMQLVARDQQIRAYRTAALQQYQTSGVVTGYRRLAAKNDRTCLACLVLDGTEQETSELMALHPQDRCTVVPNLRRFKPVQFETGMEWFKKQPPDVQETMMGSDKYKAWRSGKFTFPQLASKGEHEVWGPTVRVTSLKSLLDPPKPPKATLKGWKQAGGHRGAMWKRPGTNIFIEDNGAYGFALVQGIVGGKKQYFGTREEAILVGNALSPGQG